MNDGIPPSTLDQPVRFCKDCIHFADRDGGRCLNAPKLDLVTGKTSYYSASTIRTSGVEGDCGAAGIHWRPR